MGKSTTVKSSKKGSSDPLTKVKKAGVTKPADSPKAKSKKIAKEVAEKASKKKSKKVESESESSDSSEDDSEEESSDSSESEEEEKPKKKAANGKKAAAPAKKEESSDSSDSESDAESSDSSDSEEEAKPKAKEVKTNGAAKKAESSDSDDSSDSDSEESEEKPAAKADASSDSDSDSDSSDSDSDEKEEAPKAEEPSKKRKALDDPVIPPKKARTEDMSEQSSTLFVGSLAWAVNDDILYQAFSEFPDLTSARVITDREGGRSRGFGYVDFSNPESAKAALEANNGKELEGRAMNIDFSGKRPERSDNPNDRANDRAQRHGDSLSAESDTLFVGNISFEMDQDTVRDFFASVAEVTSVRLPTDPESGSLKGFGYVSFNNIEDAKLALTQLNGQYLGEGSSGRAVRLDYAGQRPQRDGGGGGRGGFGGRGGGRGGFGDRGGRGGRGGGRGGFGDRGGRGGRGGGRGGFSSTNRGGLGDFKGTKMTF